MRPVIFQAFEPGVNSPDKLFDFLESAHSYWQFERLGPNSRLHKYNWPEIILTEKMEKIPDLLAEERKWDQQDYSGEIDLKDSIDHLGKYCRAENKLNIKWITFSKIYLYVKRIEETANKFKGSAAGQNYHLDDIIFHLTDIVLVHEMMHAIMCLTLKHPLNNSTKEGIYFHEGIAQYFAHLIAGSNTGLPADLFNWLTNRQTHRYKVFQKLLSFRVEDVLAGVAVCTKQKKESWTELLNAVNEATRTAGCIEDKFHSCLKLREAI